MDIRRPRPLSETAADEVPGSGTYVWEIPENRLTWSKGLLRLYGLTKPPSGDNGFAALVHPEDRLRVEAETSSYLELGDSYEHEFRIVRPDGTVRKVHDRGAIDRDASGVAIRIRGINVDVTAFRDDTGELAAARRTIVDLVERSPFGIFTVDADLTLVQVSQGARAFLRNVLPLLGSRFETTLTALVGERMAHHVLGHFRHTLETGEPFHVPANFEARDAGPADLIDWRIERVVLGDGRFGVVCHFFDLSRQYRHEKTLRENKARLELAYSAAGMGAWDLDLTTHTSTWSPELYDLLGLDRGLPTGPDLLFDLVLPKDLPVLMRKFLAAIDAGSHFEDVFRIRRPDGEIRFIAGRGQVVERDAAGPTRMIGVNFDVTERAGAERKVRESEARLRKLIDSSIAFVAILDDEGKIIDANAPFLETGGIQRADVIGVPLWQSPWWSGSPEAAQRLQGSLRRLRLHARTLVRRGEGMKFEEELRFGGHGLRTILFSLFPDVDAEGRLRQIVLSGLDITDRKRTEDALRLSESRFRAFAAATNDVVYCMNPDWSEMLYLDGGEFIPDRLKPGTGWLARYIPPSDRAQVAQAIERAIEARDVFELEHRVKRDDGSLGWTSSRAVPIKNAEGEVEEWIGAAKDITRRKEDEERLEAAERTFRQMIEGSPFGIFVIDGDFRFAQASEGVRAVFGGADPPIGRDFAEIQKELWPEPLASEIIERFRHTLTTGESYRAPASMERRVDLDTSEAYDWRIERITLPDGRHGVVCHFYDLSERKRHEEHVKLLMHELNHRSKNMLSLVQAIARQTGAGETKDFLHRFGQRLRALAASQDLLVRHAWKSVPLEELVRSQLAHLFGTSEGRVALDGPPLRLSAAAAQAIGLALHELWTNAAKYGALSTEEGHVKISWDVMAHGDDGPGFRMTWEEGGGPPVTEPKRRGFGTTVITRMVEMNLGGSVTLKYPPTGLVWRMKSPAASVIEGDHCDGRPEKAAVQPEGRRVLVVEDELLIATEIARSLSEAGFEVIGPVASVDAALTVLGQEGCDLAVLDVKLGDETSEEIARELTARKKPFVVVSGTSRKHMPPLLKAVPHISKPVRPHVLEAELERFVDRRTA